MGPSPAHKLIPMRSELLQPGMFVAELDRSWLHSPFADTGFRITSARQIEQLRQVCAYVYVDPELSDSTPGATAPRAAAPVPAFAAERVVDGVLAALATIVGDARRHGLVDLAAVSRCAEALVRASIHDADALHWFLRTDRHGGLLHRRAIGTAVAAVCLGERIGLDTDARLALAAGGLLLDIGKVAVPVAILAKPGPLEGGEQPYVRRHVERGVELLAGRDLPPRALEMLVGHHERIDGSGYPHGLSGTAVPLYARIAAIADVFDAMTLNRHYAAAVSPHAALRQLEASGGERFDAALVAELAAALGPYPVGTPVETATGLLGLVCARAPRDPCRPRVILTHDAERTPLASPRLATGDDASILRALPPTVARFEGVRAAAALRELHYAA